MFQTCFTFTDLTQACLEGNIQGNHLMKTLMLLVVTAKWFLLSIATHLWYDCI